MFFVFGRCVMYFFILILFFLQDYQTSICVLNVSKRGTFCSCFLVYVCCRRVLFCIFFTQAVHVWVGLQEILCVFPVPMLIVFFPIAACSLQEKYTKYKYIRRLYAKHCTPKNGACMVYPVLQALSFVIACNGPKFRIIYIWKQQTCSQVLFLTTWHSLCQ